MPLYNTKKRHIKKSLKVFRERYWDIRKELIETVNERNSLIEQLEEVHKILDTLNCPREVDGEKLSAVNRLEKVSPISIFLILRNSFDGYENGIDSARSQDEIGFVMGEEKAKDIVEIITLEYGNEYTSWDGEQYPNFLYKELKLFDINSLKKEKELFIKKRESILGKINNK